LGTPHANTKPDPVLQYLIGINLAAHEAEYRSVLDSIAKPDQPFQIRDYTIATTAILMYIGGTTWPIVSKVVTTLNACTDEQLQDACVAILNGSHLILPKGDDVVTYELVTMRQVAEGSPPPFVSVMYHVNNIYEETKKVVAR
jgi:threonine dehydratase